MKRIIVVALLLICVCARAQNQEEIVNTLIKEKGHYQKNILEQGTSVSLNAALNSSIASFWKRNKKEEFIPTGDYLEYRSREVLELINSQPQFFKLKFLQQTSVEDVVGLIESYNLLTYSKEKKNAVKIENGTRSFGENFSGCVWLVTYEFVKDSIAESTWHVESMWPHTLIGYSAAYTNFFCGRRTCVSREENWELVLGTYKLPVDIPLFRKNNTVTIVVYDDVRVVGKKSGSFYAPLCFGAGDLFLDGEKILHVQEVSAEERIFPPIRISPCNTLPGKQLPEPIVNANSATFWSTADSLQISFFDSGLLVDGDAIGVAINGVTVLSELELTKEEMGFNIANKNITNISLKVMNEGTAPPCTVTFKVRELPDGKVWGPYDLGDQIYGTVGNTLTITLNRSK